MRNFMQKSAFVFLLAFVFFVGGCGLDTTYNVGPPISSGNPPVYNNFDKTLNFFSFNTNEVASENISVAMQGTAILYKIYHNTSVLDSVTAAIDTLNTSSTSTSDAAYRSLISRGYQELGMQGGASSPLIGYADENRSVVIRLTKYQENANPEWEARITINGNLATSKVPRRFGNNTSFDWGRRESQDDTELNRLPVSSDNDYNSTGNFTEENVYYVDAYAVNVGWDESFAQQFSRVLHLGTVRINSTERDN